MKKILVNDHTGKTPSKYYLKIKGVFVPSKERQSRPKNV